MADPTADAGASVDARLELLAQRLIARHVHLAVPDSRVRDRLVEDHGRTLYDPPSVERDMRCIAVVGAGASAPMLDRSDDLATKLETTFGRDEAELERLQLVNNLDTATFETRLIALSNSPAAERRVRETISEKYGIRHPSLLGYELTAHLLKHRFLDAIISFNFDELLDQSLDDELDAREYHRVVSERDCHSLRLDPNAPDYVPLYVKLHGTASEPESLRFTPHSYYAIPKRILGVVESLLHAEHCAIVNIGSNLGSFDFQRLLRIPTGLEVFNLSVRPIPRAICRKVDQERRQVHDDRVRFGTTATAARAGDWLHECSGGGDSNALVARLIEAIECKTGSEDDDPAADGTAEPPSDPRKLRRLVSFRSVQRHTTLAQLLSADAAYGVAAADPTWARQQQIVYTWRRTILELALAGAKARGLLSLDPLVVDRPARAFDQYQRLTCGQGDTWSALCSAAGLKESEEIPDILVSQRALRKDPEAEMDEDRALHEFNPRALARHVLNRIKNNPVEDPDVDLLAKTIDGLQRQSDVEFHMRDDRVCTKAFKQPVTLATATSMLAYTWLMLHDIDPDDEIHISAETGGWLLREPARSLLSRQRCIRLLLAFDIERDDLMRTYGRALRPRVIDPWRHNRHMTIVCRGSDPVRAIYFARRLRAPVITAVYLDSIRDVKQLRRLYDHRWDEAEREEAEREEAERQERARRRRSSAAATARASRARRRRSGDGGN